MTWLVLYLLVIFLGLSLLSLLKRRHDSRALRQAIRERETAKERGSHKAQLQYPHVDLSLCIGCGSCIRACPEEGVLALIYGQAAVVHGSRCVGHAACATACPTGGLQVVLTDIETREDIPILHENFEVKGSPGLYLAGEVTGYALVKTAITHGSTVAEHAIAKIKEEAAPETSPQEDLIIIGAGPAGLSCALRAKELGVDALILEQSTLGGTVSKYPRRKLVMTQPVELPLHGKLKRTSYFKEELMELWENIAKEQKLRIETDTVFTGLAPCDGGFEVCTKTESYHAKKVVLCLGRRGTPRKLGVEGEDLPKVVYDLVDAASYEGRKILVVGGGDSAIEAAVALAGQRGNHVTLSYRKHAFFRIKSKNETRLQEAVESGTIELLLSSQVKQIEEEEVTLAVSGQNKSKEEDLELRRIRNDDVFVFAGGIPPFDVLKSSGVSFDPKLRTEVSDLSDKGTGILRALSVSFVLSLIALAWFWSLEGYYALPFRARPDHDLHEQLKPASLLGLVCGVAASFLLCLNLLYLLRRSRIGARIAGTLQYWLSMHMVTGLLAMIFLMLHSAMIVRGTTGGQAFIGVVVLVLTGGLGRYIYSYLPKAANGQESAAAGAKDQMQALLTEWDQVSRPWGEAIQTELDKLVHEGIWEKPFLKRAFALITSRVHLRKSLTLLTAKGREQGLAETQIQQILELAKRLHKAALITSNLEGIRGLLSSWRFVHRWIALGMVLLAAIHIFTALRFARFG